jgi:hypothetical protein
LVTSRRRTILSAFSSCALFPKKFLKESLQIALILIFSGSLVISVYGVCHDVMILGLLFYLLPSRAWDEERF